MMPENKIPILIVSYPFPPRGGVGVQRITKFVKYLPENGFLPIVLTVDKPSGSVPEDPSLLDEIPDDVVIYRTKSFEPYHIYRALGGKKKQDDPSFRAKLVADGSKGGFLSKMYLQFQRQYLIPDPKIGWFNPAMKRAEEIIKKHSPRLIFSTSPEATAHLIALKLHKKTGLPFIADFRDPWIDGYYSLNRPKTAALKEKKMESDIINSASAVIVVMESIIEGFKKNHGIDDNSKFHVIPNGFDEADYNELSPCQFDKFTIVHTGSIYHQRSPVPFFEAMADFLDGNPEARNDFQTLLMGRIDHRFIAYANKIGIDKVLNVKPFAAHSKSLETQLGADALLILSEGVLTAKVYEYLRARKPILGFAPNGELSQTVYEWSVGKIFNELQVKEASNFIAELYHGWRQGKNPIWEHYKEVDLAPFERANQTEALAGIMKELC